jgi:hypothetical protein
MISLTREQMMDRPISLKIARAGIQFLAHQSRGILNREGDTIGYRQEKIFLCLEAIVNDHLVNLKAPFFLLFRLR